MTAATRWSPRARLLVALLVSPRAKGVAVALAV
jgi:hypothetical protein